jgi:hypothetical protein
MKVPNMIYGVTVSRPDANAAAALSAAINSARRTGRGEPVVAQRSGVLDRQRLSRVATGDRRVFTRPLAPGPQRVRVTILVDASSSMCDPIDSPVENPIGWANSPRRYRVALQLMRDLADATTRLPWVRASMLGFTTAQTYTSGDACTIYPLWETGQPSTDVNAYASIPMNGTEEGYALAIAGDLLKESLRKDEQPLIIIISDGSPSERRHVTSVVQTLKAQGIPVCSVALTKSAAQQVMYGTDNVVQWTGSSRALARGIAAFIGRVL